MRDWKGDPSQPLVSICCIAYNHESYIDDALEGFLIQETDFPFEILIHEDASTDRTADIIREYKNKYPNLIKPIYQVENQYSKGRKLNAEFNIPRARGEYIAFCEGDDFWIYSGKLKTQVELMMKHDSINLSFHPARKIIEKPVFAEMTIAKRSEHEKIYSLNDVILGGGGFMPTASLMVRRVAVMNLPKFFYEVAPVGDYYIQVIASSKGALYFPGVYSKYRFMHDGSWSRSQLSSKVATERFYKSAAAMKELASYLPSDYLATVKEAFCGLAVRHLFNPIVPFLVKARTFDGEFSFISFREFQKISITKLAPKYIRRLTGRIMVKIRLSSHQFGIWLK